MMKTADAAKVIDQHRSGGILVATMSTSHPRFGLPKVTTNAKWDLPIPIMSKASSIGLGLALARPERKIMVLDGDGSLVMNLGSLITIGNKAPRNLYHFLFNNGVYAITGGQPVPGEGTVKWGDLVRAAGYRSVFSFDDLEDFTTGIKDVVSSQGPVFVHLLISPDIPDTQPPPSPTAARPASSPAMRMKQAVKEMTRLLASESN